MQEYCQVSLTTNEVGDNQLSSLPQCVPCVKLCWQWALVTLVPVHAAVRKDDCVRLLLCVLAKFVLWAVVLGVL